MDIMVFSRRLDGIAHTAEEASSYLKSNCDMLPLDLIGLVMMQNNKQKLQAIWDFPGGSVDKTLCSQCRGPGFDPWSGN